MPLVEVDDIYFHYPRAVRGPGDEGWTLRGISLEVGAGSTLGIVGESGSGKSTLIRVMCGLLRHQRGTVRFDGRDLGEFRGDHSTELRRRNQIVFQNPRRSLDPRMTVRRSLSEPVRALQGRRPGDDELAAALERVGLRRDLLARFPHQLSGGHFERDPVQRPSFVTRTEDGPGVVEVDVGDFDDGHEDQSSPAGFQQRNPWPSPLLTSAGVCAHEAVSCAQRLRKRHPLGK